MMLLPAYWREVRITRRIVRRSGRDLKTVAEQALMRGLATAFCSFFRLELTRSSLGPRSNDRSHNMSFRKFPCRAPLSHSCTIDVCDYLPFWVVVEGAEVVTDRVLSRFERSMVANDIYAVRPMISRLIAQRTPRARRGGDRWPLGSWRTTDRKRPHGPRLRFPRDLPHPSRCRRHLRCKFGMMPQDSPSMYGPTMYGPPCMAMYEYGHV